MIHSYHRGMSRASFRIVTILGALCLGVSLPPNAFADGIFDDDWSPPLKMERAPQPLTPSPAKPTPADPEPHPALRTPTTRTEIKKIPSKSDLAASRKLLKEAYSKELADRSAKARRDIAQKLLDEAKRNDDSPADQFALFGGAIEAAREGGTIHVCFDAIDELSGRYNVDGLSMKADAVVKLSPSKGDPPAIVAENIQSTLDLLDALVTVDDFQSASRVGVALQKLAQPVADQRAVVQASIRKLNELRVAYQRLAPQLDKLKVSPDDADANLAVGKYYCFQKGEWERGLPMLAIGSDQTLQGLAGKEAASPTDTATTASIGDGWWDLGQKEGLAAGSQIRIHAAKWYRVSLEGLKGLARIKVDKRIEEAGQVAEAKGKSGRIIDLLPLVKLPRDAVHGTWQIEKGAAIAGVSAGNHGKLRLPYTPPAEYDLEIQFTRATPNSGIAQMLCHADKQFLWVVAERGRVFTLGSLTDPAEQKKAIVEDPTLVTAGKRHTSIVRVRNHSITTYLDGKQIVRLETDYSNISLPETWSVGSDALGIGAFDAASTFHVIHVTEISGKGKLQGE